MKAMHQRLGQEAFGHSVVRMVKDLPREHSPGEDLLLRAANLDKLYIPTRNPNGFPEGAPMDYFGRDDAETAIRDAEAILAYAKTGS